MDPPYDLLVTLAAWSGLRRGELAGLRVRRVDTDRHRIDVQETVINLGGERHEDTPKSEDSRRSVPIPPPVAKMLADHVAAHDLGPDDYVFGQADGSAMNMPAFYRTEFRKGTEAAGLVGLRFHDLRHTYASLMAHHGEDIHRVSKWMGHSTIAITADLYTHLFEDDDTALSDRLAAAFATSTAANGNVVPLRAKRTG
jgi:integrase